MHTEFKLRRGPLVRAETYTTATEATTAGASEDLAVDDPPAEEALAAIAANLKKEEEKDAKESG